MLVYILCAIAVLSQFTSGDNVKRDTPENELFHDKLLGVDTEHGIPRIDKDTIITKNLKLEQRKKGSKKTSVDPEPDWSYSDFPPETRAHVDQFKSDMAECLKEVQANDKRTVQRLSPNRDSPVHGECLIACVLKKNGVIRHKKINKENLIALVGKFYMKDSRLMKNFPTNAIRFSLLIFLCRITPVSQ
uniref:Odorant-binding protein n=1 Tax=Conopomorpha sinensis TaxID=940481 RepID=A0AAU8BCX6_9NEOP